MITSWTCSRVAAAMGSGVEVLTGTGVKKVGEKSKSSGCFGFGDPGGGVWASDLLLDDLPDLTPDLEDL